jgi:hypothetical protein
MPDQEQVAFDIDPRSVLGAIKQMNSAMEGYEKTHGSANEKMQKAIDRTAELLLKVNDRSRSSMERLTQSIEKQAAAYGKTNAERMVAERDRIIKKLGDEKGMIDRVNESYAKMLAADAAGQGAAGMQNMGFAAQQSKASLALLGEEMGVHIPRQLRTFVTMLPGIGQVLEVSFRAVAIIALIAVLYEAVKKVLEFRKALDDLHTAAEKNAGEFARFADSQKLANLQLQTTNDQLENAIAKLQHKPENNLKVAIDEAAAAAQNLSDKMDKSLRAFAELVQKNAPSMFAQIIGGQPSTDALVQLLQGKSGFGGLQGDLYKITSAGGDPTEMLGRYRGQIAEMARQSQFAQAYQRGEGFEGFSNEDIRAGKHPKGVAMYGMLAPQEGALENLNAATREIDALVQSYALEKKHAALQGTENQLKDQLSKSSAFVISDAEMQKMQNAAPTITSAPSLYPRSAAIANANALGGWQTEFTVNQAELDKANAPTQAAIKAQMEARMKGEEDLIKKTDAQRLSSIAAEATYTVKVLALRKGPGGEIETARAVAAVREDALRRELDLTGDGVKYRQESLANERDMRLKIAEIQDKQQEKQHEELAKTSTALWNTLLTKPGDFGKQLSGTIHAAVLKPVTEGLGNLTANALKPVIYGADGTGGVAGLFGGMFGRQDPIKTATDQNTLATRQNSLAMYQLSALLARASGVSLSSLPTPAFLPGLGVLPRFGKGGVTNGPTIVGEDGRELVIPLDTPYVPQIDLRPTRNRPLVGTYGPATDAALLKAAAAGMTLALPAGLSVLGGPMGYAGGDLLMSLLTGGVAAVTPARRDDLMLGEIPVGPGGGGRYSAPEEGRSLFNKGTYEELKAIGSKGGRISGLARSKAAAQRDALRAVAQAMRGEERDQLMAEKGLFSDAQYTGPKDWDKSTAPASVSSKQLDNQFPWLKDAFQQTEAKKALIAAARRGGQTRIAQVRAARDVAALRTRGSVKGSMLWAINPDTGGVRLGQYIPANWKWSADPNLFATHADWFEKIHFPVAGPEFDRIPRGYAQIDRGRIHIIDNGLEEEQEGLTSPPLSTAQYRALTERIAKKFKLPSYDEGGTVAQTGLAMVHQGETILPSANDTLKRAIELNTAATIKAAELSHARTERLVQGLDLAMGVVAAGIGAAVTPRSVSGGWAAPSASMGTPGASGGGWEPSLQTGAWGAVGAPGGEAWATPGVSGGGPSGYGGSASGGSGYGPAGMADIYNLPNSPVSAIGGILRNGSKLGGIFSKGGFGDLKGMFGIQGTPQSVGMYGDTISTGLPTSFKSVMGSQAVHAGEAAAGTALFEAGAFGERRGTWAGVGETTAGGAAFGAQFGPWGAAIGAVAGFGVGIGEKAAGVESKENEAKRLVKQIYGLSINNDMARQIAGIAKQTFGNNVGMAVRSDQVQKLLRLWAETMGKQTALVNLTPHSASLMEAGGKMYQNAVYDNGQAYTYGSQFGTYGGISSQNLPTASPYAGATITLNPQQTVDLWRTGTTQAIADNPRGVAASALAGNQASAARSGNAVNSFAPEAISQ